MIADSVAYLQGRRAARCFYDAEHFFDGYQAQPRVRPADAAGRAGGRRQRASSCATPTAARCPSRSPSACERSARLSACDARHPLPQRLRPGRRQHAGRRRAQGATQVQGTINGIGERCGNVDLVSVIANLALKHGYDVLAAGQPAAS